MFSFWLGDRGLLDAFKLGRMWNEQGCARACEKWLLDDHTLSSVLTMLRSNVDRLSGKINPVCNDQW